MIDRRPIAAVLAIVGLGTLIVLTPRTEDPDSTLALRRYIGDLGVRVSERDGLPASGGSLILPADARAQDEFQPILDWVETGGQLVVMDPTSEVVPMVGASDGPTVGFVGSIELRPTCVAPGVLDVDRILVAPTDQVLIPDDPAFVACFPTGDGAWMLSRRLGRGTVTLLGGASPFTNDLLREADNAVLAAGLAGDPSEVVFGPPVAALPGSSGVWDVLPDRVRAFLVGLVLAAVAFALLRARRLGGPMLESPITPIPGSELVRATGRLYRQARATGYAGRTLRDTTMQRLRSRFFAGATGDLAGAISRQGGLPRDRVERILDGPEPRTDDDLIALGAELESLVATTETRST